MLTVRQLADELKASGWSGNRKIHILAARYYKGLETRETLRFAGLPDRTIQAIVESR